MQTEDNSRERKRSLRQPLLGFFVIFALTLGTYLSDLSSYGVTWDEFFHRGTGHLYLNFLRTGELQPVLDAERVAWFPPVAVTLGEYFLEHPRVQKVVPAPADRFHLAAVLFGSLTVGWVFLLGYFVSGKVVMGLLASVLLATDPQWITHAHDNVRDVGMTMLYTLTILVLLVGVQSRRWMPYWMALAGLLAGITTDAKQNGAFLIVIGILLLFRHIRALGVARSALSTILFGVSFGVGFVGFWPYLWTDTLGHAKAVWQFLTDPASISLTTTFFDRVYTSGIDIPFYYPWVMLSIVTPPVFAALAASGLAASGIKLFTGDKAASLLFLWMFVPLSRFAVPKSAVAFDQIRHFLEVLPCVALLAAYGWQFIVLRALRKLPWGSLGAALVACLAIAQNATIVLRYHPYGTAYFNFLAGDSLYVTHAFDVEFWGNVYREAAPVLNRRHDADVTYYSAGVGAHLLAENGLRGKLTDEVKDDFQVVVFMNKQNWLRKNPYVQWLLKNKKPVFTIDREGAILFYEFEPYKEEYLSASSGVN